MACILESTNLRSSLTFLSPIFSRSKPSPETPSPKTILEIWGKCYLPNLLKSEANFFFSYVVKGIYWISLVAFGEGFFFFDVDDDFETGFP